MQMKHIRLALLVMLLCLLAVAIPAGLAQDIPGLSAADAEVLTTAIENSSEADSFSFTYSGEFSVTGEDGLTATFSGEGQASDAGFRLTLAGSATVEGDPQPFDFELRGIDEAVYIGFGGMWLSATQSDIEALGEQFGGMLPVNPTDMSDPQAMQDMMQQPGMMEAMTALATLDPADFTNVVRTDEGGSAVFTTTVDFAMLSQNEGVQALIGIIVQQAQAQAQDGDAPSEAEIAALREGIPQILAGTTLDIKQSVDQEMQMINGFGLALTTTVDPAAFGDNAPAATIAVSFDVEIGGYNEAYEFAVPPNAQPLSEMLGMMMGGMASGG